MQKRWALCFDGAILTVLLAFTLWQLGPALLFTDTLTVGGDTPAHHYLASHLKTLLFGHGRLVGWAHGWWAGFPMFQYYFYLPYLLIVLLSCLIPYNVAFKLIAVLGTLALPGAMAVTARLLRLPRPIPILTAIACVPFLFVQSHTMWGANVYSTLAGMIANSISFPIMLLAVGSAFRDATDGLFRARTVVILFLLISSHFFTTIMAGLIILMMPMLLPSARRRAAIRALLPTAVITLMVSSWWLLPLIARRDFSVDFGTNWDVDLLATLPTYVPALLPFCVIALLLGLRQKRTGVILLGGMLLLALILFVFGYALTPVFVNIRLWPFMFFALLMLAACGVGLLVSHRRHTEWLVLALLLTALTQVAYDQGNPSGPVGMAKPWAAFNFAGREERPAFRVIDDLIMPLAGTPGRLANDLNESNNAIGSSRIFEAVPHLIDKPIIEGGLVNSGLSSYFTYYIQCETSRSCAGYPTLVNPTTFNLANATRHLELFNVKHFIARWPPLRLAMQDSPDWKLINKSGPWELFELTTHDGHYVTIPRFHPQAVATHLWKENALEWMYTIDAVDKPFVFLRPGQTPPDQQLLPIMDESIFREAIRGMRHADADIEEWLHLGPFHYPRTQTDPLSYAPRGIDEASLRPTMGQRTAGLTWEPLFSRCPIFPSRLYRSQHYLVAYSYTTVISPDKREALLHYGNDDGARIWLNGTRVVDSAITGLDNLKTQRVTLEAGPNHLLHKTQEHEGGHFFHVRLTDLNQEPFADLHFQTQPGQAQAPPPRPVPVEIAGRGVIDETIEPLRIRFRTDAIGQPHIIKCSFYPNWKVRGARAVYLVSPAFMLVYPDQPEVELIYSRLPIDRAGLGISLAGWLLLLAMIRRQRAK
ncbi:MAG: hypothetical protein O3A51_09315 [Verrucomicrobia bacterium]|nr:hypothetical protein [Verrucomicrobiota bacterium]